MGQVTSGVKKDSGGTALPGYSFGYGFDTIGNRESATRESHTEDYWTNALNQITAIEYQGYHHVLGSADSAATVTVDGLATQRSNSLFYGSVSGGNTYEQFEIRGVLAGAGDGRTDAVSVIDAAAYIPESSNTFTHDESGNLTEDSEWTFIWDAENRLVQMETRPSVVNAGAPHRRLTFEYDSQSRRTRKTVELWDGSAWQTEEDIRFLWNDWLLSAELEADTLEPIRSYTWGLDLAGTREQTGGVGGLALVKHHKNGEVSVPLYTTNGNVRGYWEIDTDALVAEFEYGPFGELLKATGEKVGKHPFRWSTKYEDTENGLLYYGYRFFDPETGRWLSRDPIEEEGGLNLYTFIENDSNNSFDYLGQQGGRTYGYSYAVAVVRSTYRSWASRYPFASNLMQYWLEENIRVAGSGATQLANYIPTSADEQEVLRYGIGGGVGVFAGRGGKISSEIKRVLWLAAGPSSYSSGREEVRWGFFDNGKMFRAYGGARIWFSSSSISYRKPHRNSFTLFHGSFDIRIHDSYRWPSEFAATISRTYRAAKYLQDHCGFVHMDHEMNLTKRY